MNMIHSYGRIENHDCVQSPFRESIDWNASGWWNGHFIVIEEREDILVIQSTNEATGYAELEIKTNGFKVIGKPSFLTNDIVKIKAKNKTGRIYNVTYHSARECFRYMVDYGNRKSTCWYYDNDLEKAGNQCP